MFTKLKKKIAEEAAVAPRPGSAARIPRSVSKESITSAGADSGDDFASDGSSSRDDLPSQISKRNNQIRRLEAKLSEFAEQFRNMQKMKEKLELALEKHQDSTVRKFQEQNEAHQTRQAKMAEEHVLALEKKDQEWLAKIESLEEEKKQLSNQIDTMTKQSLTFFQKREDTDDLDVFQQEEIAKLKYMLLEKEELISQEEQELELLRKEVVVLRAECQDAHGLSARLQKDLQKVQVENEKLSQQRTELTATQEGAEKKITELEIQQQELQDFIQHLSLDLQKAQSASCTTEKRLTVVQEEYEVLNLHYEQLKSKVTDLNSQIEENIQEISLKNEELIRKDEETSILKQDYDALVLKMQQFQSDLELYKTRTADGVESSAWHASSGMPQLQEQKAVQLASESQVSSAQEAVSALHQPLNGAISWKSNGEVKVADILQLQRENQELEQQIVEKNKTIKQLQQRMVELKKTLQKELKLKPEPEVNDMQEKLNPDQLATSLTVTSLSDLTDSREINFEYLKHVVLKFMSSREAEAFHLIKAVSVLLNFSVEEENLLKETLEYKMSWFGSKPVPKGSVRPSISKPRTTWS